MRDNSTSSRSKFSSWGTDKAEHIASELKSRRLYNETRGTQFEGDTKIVRDREGQTEAPSAPAGNTSRNMGKSSPQSTMGLLSSSRGTRSLGGSNFFEKLARDAQTDPGAQQAQSKGSTSSWLRGMGGNVPQDKRGALERQLKWMAKLEAGTPPAATHPSQQMHLMQNPQPSTPTHLQAADPGGQELSPMPPMQDMIGTIADTPPQAQPLVNDSLKAALIQPANAALFASIRNRIGNLLLNELPPDVTAELRLIGKDLEDLNRRVNNT
jgi:hypothetical protein